MRRLTIRRSKKKSKKDVYVSGPINVEVLENKELDMIVYLYSDEHNSRAYSCTDLNDNTFSIEKYLYNIFSTTTKYIDFYLEAPFIQIEDEIGSPSDQDKRLHLNNSKYDETYLVRTRELFSYYGCFYRLKKDCQRKFPKVRFHAIDYRYNFTRKSIIIQDLQELLDNLIKLVNTDFDNNFSKIQKITKKLLKILYKFNTYDKYLDLIKKCLKDKKIKKQITRCTKKIQGNIDNFFQKLLLKYEQIYTNVYNYFCEKIISKLESISINNPPIMLRTEYMFFYRIIIETESIIMDKYTLGRLLKKYKKHHEKHKINIIYAGGSHILNYKLFLVKELKFKVINRSTFIKKRCHNLKGIHNV